MLELGDGGEPEGVDAARGRVRAEVLDFREKQRAVLQARGERKHSANPVSCFGCPTKAFQESLRATPGRITPAQWLGGWIAMFVALEARLREIGWSEADGWESLK